MYNFLYSILLLTIGFNACAQVPTERPATLNSAFDKKISKTINFSVPVIGVEALKTSTEKVYLLDAREKAEYDISHIPNATYIGFDKVEATVLENIPKDAKIVLYCSIGYRSEKIGEVIQQAGFTNVHNLYGSIFEWVNQGNPLEDKDGNPTTKVHTYNKKWSKWVEEGKAEKVW